MMCKTAISLASLTMVLAGVLALGLPGPVHAAHPTPVAWWKLDGDALDASGNERHGSLQGNPQWIAGVYGQALAFDGDDTVTIDGFKGILGTQAFTITAWIRADGNGEIIGWGSSGDGNRAEFRVDDGRLRYESGGGNVQADTTVSDSTWHHAAVTIPADAQYVDVTIYLDGEEDTQPETDTDVVHPAADFDAIMGQRYNRNGRWYNGAIDDLRIYDRVLTQEEIQEAMEGIGPVSASASGPSPENESIDLPRDVVLSWTPGELAPAVNGHKLFFSENATDVTDGVGGVIQDANSYAPAQLLDFGKTYYWRVDEINAPPDSTVFPGEVWQFTVEPFARPIPGDAVTATASSQEPGQGPENTTNGVGLGDDDVHSQDVMEMWLSSDSEPNQAWIEYSFDQVYKLDRMVVWNHNSQPENFIGFGVKDALIEYSLDGTQWLTWGLAELASATVAPMSEVNLQGLVAQAVRITAQSNWGGIFSKYGLSEVRFLHIPVFARQAQPDAGQTDVPTDVTLSWTAGREAAEHDIYVGTDPNALPLVGSVNENSFDTQALDLRLDQTYYWRVDEVNHSEDPSVWPGEVWGFSTQANLIVDDFEAYDDDCNRIFFTWEDGFGHSGSEGIEDCTVAPSDGNGSGSIVGHAEAPFAETGIVRGARQALPLFYDGPSETTRRFGAAQDWTRAGIQGLVLYFYGDPENAPAQLYVRINDTKVPYDGDMKSLQRIPWQKWYIPLGDHLSENELAQVRSLSTGIEGSAQGVLIFDDISLTGGSRSLVTPVEPAPENLVAHYAFDGDTSDSTGSYPATPTAAKFEAGKVDQAISLAGVFGDFVEITGFKGILGSSAITITAWINTSATETGTIIGWGPQGSVGTRFGFRVDNNRLRCENSAGSVLGTAVVNGGGWHHVAVTVQENATISYPDVTLWVDGRDDTQPSIDDSIFEIIADNDARIGSRPSVGDRWFNGLIDELYIYDRALSAEEIAGAAGRVAPFDE